MNHLRASIPKKKIDSRALDIKYAILSKQAGLRIDGEHGEDRLNGVEINKISIDGETMHSFIRLNFTEWFDLYNKIPEIYRQVKQFSNAIFKQVMLGRSDPASLENYKLVISNRVAVSVSVFKPKTRHFIFVSIHSYQGRV